MTHERELRHSLRDSLARARARTDEVFSLVGEEALYERPVPERHRLVFYLGHLEAFDANLLLRDSLGRVSDHPDADRLFAFGIDPMGTAALPTDEKRDWPSLAEVRRYVLARRAEVDQALGDTPLLDPLHPNLQDGWAVRMAIEHRLMHAETLAYLVHQLPYSCKVEGPLPETVALEAPPRSLRFVPAGQARLGLSRALSPYDGWDNEYEATSEPVEGFSMDTHDVTNHDFMAFVTEGGYRERSLWTDEDWAWISSSGRAHPPFWVSRGAHFRYRAMFGEVPLGPSWPVYVSHAEAAAYALWRGLALPTEAQYHRAAFGTEEDTDRPYPWGAWPPSSRHGVFGFSRWDPAPVGTHPQGDSSFGIADLVGNGWEWTASTFAPFPGFEPLPFYAGYSAEFFDGRHYVLKGGSPRTDSSLLRRSFRNWFQPQYPYAYATFRCVGG